LQTKDVAIGNRKAVLPICRKAFFSFLPTYSNIRLNNNLPIIFDYDIIKQNNRRLDVKISWHEKNKK
jgi:hypothetical protein